MRIPENRLPRRLLYTAVVYKFSCTAAHQNLTTPSKTQLNKCNTTVHIKVLHASPPKMVQDPSGGCDSWLKITALQWALLRPTHSGESEKKRLNDHINFLYAILDELARDRDEWRVVCDSRVTIFKQEHITVFWQKAKGTLVRRQQQRNSPPTTRRQGSVCAMCGRFCAPGCRLRSRTHHHKGTRWPVSLSIDGQLRESLYQILLECFAVSQRHHGPSGKLACWSLYDKYSTVLYAYVT